MDKHIHIRKVSGNAGRCLCGDEICLAVFPKKGHKCTLTKGHQGFHINEWIPEEGSWKSAPKEPEVIGH